MFKKGFFLLSGLISTIVSTHAVASNDVPLSWGRVDFSAAAATNNLGIFSSDLLLPVYGNQNHFFYGDVMGDKATDGAYLISPGIGYRKVYHNQFFGIYFFDDFQQTSLGENFQVLSPGVEWVTPRWDFHVNGYFPTTTQQQSGAEDFASAYGDNNHTAYSGHDGYDELVTPYAVIGRGVDSAVGYSFDSNPDHLRGRVYFGTYYYQAPADTDVANITGVTLGFSKAMTKNLSMTMANSYDSVTHYNVNIGLSLTFGGDSAIFSNDISDRLFDTVERHIGIIGSGAGQYDQQSLQESGDTVLQYDNLYFVSPDGNGDGTYEDPMALDQSSLDTTYAESPDGAMIYVQGDSDYYINSSAGSTQNGTSGLYVYNNQDFYGRSSDYTAPASFSEQPEITTQESYNGFVTQGGENTFSDLYIISANSGDSTGIIATVNNDDDQTLTIENTTITQFSTGVSATNNGTGALIINAINSQFNGNTSDDNAYGMLINNNSFGTTIANLTHSQFNDNSVSGSDNALVAGLSASNSGSGNLEVNATDSQFNNNSAVGNNANGYGVYLVNSGSGNVTLDVNNSNFDANEASGNGSPMAAGLYAYNLGVGNFNFNIADSSFNQNVAGDNGYAYGLSAINAGSGNLTINASHSQFDNNAVLGTDPSNAIGFYAANNDRGALTINVDSSEFNNNSSEFAAYGMFISNGAGGGITAVSATNSQFNNNDGEGLHVENLSTVAASTLAVTDLSGSIFVDNATYGIYATATRSNTTTVNYTDVVFQDNAVAINSNNNVNYIG